MSYHDRTLITIICEAMLEEKIIALAKQFGVVGYTVLEARGEGTRGLREGDFEYSKNIKIEILCTAETANAVCEAIRSKYFKDYAAILYQNTVSVMRPDKFN